MLEEHLKNLYVTRRRLVIYQILLSCSTNILHGLSALSFYNNQINVCTLIGQSAVGYCAGKPTEKSRAFWIII